MWWRGGSGGVADLPSPKRSPVRPFRTVGIEPGQSRNLDQPSSKTGRRRVCPAPMTEPACPLASPLKRWSRALVPFISHVPRIISESRHVKVPAVSPVGVQQHVSTHVDTSRRWTPGGRTTTTPVRTTAWRTSRQRGTGAEGTTCRIETGSETRSRSGAEFRGLAGSENPL